MKMKDLFRYTTLRLKRARLLEDLEIIEDKLTSPSSSLPPSFGGCGTGAEEKIVHFSTLADNIKKLILAVDEEITAEYNKLMSIEDKIETLQLRQFYHYRFIYGYELQSAADAMCISLRRAYTLNTKIKNFVESI